MKRTARQNCFETNSSSVHSLTVKSKIEHEKLPNLVQDNVLYPDVFYAKGRSYKDDDCWYIYDGTSWTANTKDEKAALLFLYLNYDDIAKDRKQYLVNQAKLMLDYKDVILGEDSLCYGVDRGELAFPLEVLSPWNSDTDALEQCEKMLDEFVAVIKDDSKVIEVIIGDN